MAEQEHGVTKFSQSQYRTFLFSISALLILVIFVLGFLALSDKIIPGWVLLAAYISLSVVLVLVYRDDLGFVVLTGGLNGKNRAGMLLYVLAFTIAALPIASKHAFNKMGLINVYLVFCVFVYASILSYSIVSKNKNIDANKSKFILIRITTISLLLGYGFSLVFNCSEIVNFSKTYRLAIRSKYIQTGREKGGIYHVPHFVVQSWVESETFGNDIEIPSRWNDRYPNISDIDAGDSVIVIVHPGMLNLSWLEAVKFISHQYRTTEESSTPSNFLSLGLL